MPYFALTVEACLAEMAKAHLIDATDDNHDGQPDQDVLDNISASASAEVDEYLESRYSTPLTADMFTSGALPVLVTNAARLFAIRKVFKRRAIAESELPLKEEIKRVTDLLGMIRDGEYALPGLAEDVESATQGAAVTDTMATEGSTL